MSDKLISVVVPMYFEEAVAMECYRRLSSILNSNHYNYEIIFVNDGSTDRTLQILEGITIIDPRVRVISFSRNFGHQVAITAGITKAKGDAVIVIDADLQDPPELIPDMIKRWQQGYDVVYAMRTKRKGESWFKLFTAKYFYVTLKWMTDINIPTETGDFRLMDRKVVEVFVNMPEKSRFVRGMISWIGFKQIPIEYERDERFAGETKYPLKKMLKFAFDGVISFSSKPLKVVGYLGIVSMAVAVIVFAYSLFAKLSGQDIVRGWASIIATVTFIGGVELLSVSVLGEYIARIYEENKGRPMYIIEREINTGLNFNMTSVPDINEEDLITIMLKEGVN